MHLPDYLLIWPHGSPRGKGLWFSLAGCAALVLGSPLVAAEEPADAVQRLKAELRQVLQYRDQAALELHAWKLQKMEMENLAFIAEREVRDLKAVLGKLKHAYDGVEKNRQAQDGDEVERRQFYALCAERLPKLASGLLELAAMWPEPLQSRTSAHQSVVRQFIEDEATKRPEQRKVIDAMMSAIEEAQAFQAKVNRDTLLRAEANGEQVLHEVFFLGLAVGYYRVEAQGRAGIILFQQGRWVWIEKPELAGTLADLSAIVQEKEPPRFIELQVMPKSVGKTESSAP